MVESSIQLVQGRDLKKLLIAKMLAKRFLDLNRSTFQKQIIKYFGHVLFQKHI